MTNPYRSMCAELLAWAERTSSHYYKQADVIVRARALLDQPGPQPVPVSERLPGPEDCNGDGDVWAWRRFDPEGDMDNGDFWCLAFCEWLEDEDCNFTHWLPANALPTPEALDD